MLGCEVVSGESSPSMSSGLHPVRATSQAIQRKIIGVVVALRERSGLRLVTRYQMARLRAYVKSAPLNTLWITPKLRQNP